MAIGGDGNGLARPTAGAGRSGAGRRCGRRRQRPRRRGAPAAAARVATGRADHARRSAATRGRGVGVAARRGRRSLAPAPIVPQALYQPPASTGAVRRGAGRSRRRRPLVDRRPRPRWPRGRPVVSAPPPSSTAGRAARVAARPQTVVDRPDAVRPASRNGKDAKRKKKHGKH